MKKIILCLILILPNISYSKSAITREEILKTYTLEQLDGAANTLKVVIDGTKLCQLSAKEAGQLILPLHDLIDASTKSKAGSYRSELMRWESCDRGCHCGAYAALLETVESQ